MHHRTTLLAYIFAAKACIDNQKKKLVKQQYLLHMSSQYGELPSTSGWDHFRSLGHPSKYERVSRLRFVTAPTSFTGGRPNFARCLAVSWAGTGALPQTEFFQVQNPLFVQDLRSPTLAALLHDTPAAGVSQTLWRGTRNRITKLPQRAPPIFGRAAITLGSHHVGHRPTFYFSFLLHWLLPQPAAKTPAWILTDNMSKDRGPCKKCLLRTHTHP